MSQKRASEVFDYRTLRAVVGSIAILLPVLVWACSSVSLVSISASYHTESRNLFVGMLCIVGAFLFAYNGHTDTQKFWSKVASFASILVAFFPTACADCEPNTAATIHFAAAVTLFAILAYFCLFPFRKNTKGMVGKKGRRDLWYRLCGWAIVGSIAVAGVAKLALPKDAVDGWRVVLIAEWAALWAFGLAWFIAGKTLSLFADEDEKNKLEIVAEIKKGLSPLVVGAKKGS